MHEYDEIMQAIYKYCKGWKVLNVVVITFQEKVNVER